MIPLLEFSTKSMIYCISGVICFQHALRVEKAVSLMNLLNEFVAETAAAKTYQVECAVSCWLLTGNDIWRNVL